MSKSTPSIRHTPQSIPPEIVYEVLTYQFKDYMSNDYPPTSEKFNENLRNFLKSNLTVNKTFYHICRVLIYKHCNFTTAKRFYNLLESLEKQEQLRNIIQIADFQELTSVGLGRSMEMNKQIQNLTNKTLSRFLELTKWNLREFLACENIQEDLDSNIIYFLLKPGKVLSILDFCGCSGPYLTQSFMTALEKLYPADSDTNSAPLEYNSQMACLGLNDCTDLPNSVLIKTLRMFPELQKLDLNHTSIDDNTLLNGLPHLKSLTHLSLGLCSQLTSRAILEFFSHHPTVTDVNNAATLEWLNLGVTAHSSTWNDVHTMFLLKKLCQYGHNKTLQYLNLDGLPLHQVLLSTGNSLHSSPNTSVTSLHTLNRPTTIFSSVIHTEHYYQCSDTLIFIKLNFPKLKSLSIKGNNVPIDKLIEFLSPIEDIAYYDNLKGLKEFQKLKFLNVANNSYVNQWTIQNPNLLTCSPSLCSLELGFDAWQQIEKLNSNHEFITVKYNKRTDRNDVVKWKCFLDVSYGRRYWIYRVDPYLNRGDIEQRSLAGTKFDSNGNRIIEVVKQPDFLRFAQSKISLSCGLVIKSGERRKKTYRDLKPPISQFLTRNGGIAFGNRSQPVIRPRLPPGGWRLLPEEDDQDVDRDVARHMPPNATHVGSTSTTDEDHHEVGGIYWDRSIHDLSAFGQRNGFDRPQPGTMRPPPRPPLLAMGPPSSILPAALPPGNLPLQNAEPQNDEEYLNNPDLQRRRSELSLLMSHHPLRRPGLHSNHSNTKVDTFAHSQIAAARTPTATGRPSGPRRQLVKRPSGYYYAHPQEFVYDPNDAVMSRRYQIHFEVVNEYKTFGCIERGMYRYYSLRA
ncbi:Lug1p KNAG_0B05750 [Huiozyma naganishii CBS 8797]|uniref:Uncharacterized protein n=1 Tax=Huiozyma naganishii (strain ATCC MYA-139 / BCRC 22969 / CBS 8797 / KCTC 17520 / NBRC 10181 / NCYC 3082 / Yp74L-3) TaxID=1071383 RepID=J7RVQ7_HUIN7|nr:hypothetical protein KNAG_0B05750 [Kazachstania naganishii CBS 8797]CCK69007.1 hypothetical protein KNAG_0B05750 [Kazachstania naganishii CBS 8797]